MTLHPITLTHQHDATSTVPGEPVGAHLAVTPALCGDGTDLRYTGRWLVTHVATGYTVSSIGACIRHARAAARLLAASGVDWTRPVEAIRADPLDHDAVQTVRGLLASCTDDYLACAQALEWAQALGTLPIDDAEAMW